MKNTNLLFSALILSTFSLPLMANNLPSESDLRSEAMNIVKKFGGTLKPKLKEGIQKGGFEHAIKVCAVEAPKIARDLSNETGWVVKRVSLKPRNRNAAPDEFERKALLKFNALQEKGESLASLEYAEIVGNTYRFMKAQPVEAICLGCHGNALTENVKKLIKDHYPEDIATGYSLGQVRGAFSLVKRL